MLSSVSFQAGNELIPIKRIQYPFRLADHYQLQKSGTLLVVKLQDISVAMYVAIVLGGLMLFVLASILILVMFLYAGRTMMTKSKRMASTPRSRTAPTPRSRQRSASKKSKTKE